MSSPGRSVAIRELSQRSIGVDVVAQSENGADDVVEKLRGRLALPATVGDVACPNEDRVCCLGQGFLNR